MPRFTTFADRCHAGLYTRPPGITTPLAPLSRRASLPDWRHYPAGHHYPIGATIRPGITTRLAPLPHWRHYPAGAGAG